MKVKGWILRKLAIRENVTTGAHFHVGPRSIVWAPRSLKIGDNVYIGKNCTIEVDGTIGDGSLIANNVGIVGRRDHDIHHMGRSVRSSRWVGDEPADLSVPVTVGSDVWVGFGAIILSGVTIGDSSIVGAGAVVTSDIPANSIAVGSPARVIGNRFSESDFRDHWLEMRRHSVRPVTGSHDERESG